MWFEGQTVVYYRDDRLEPKGNEEMPEVICRRSAVISQRSVVSVGGAHLSAGGAHLSSGGAKFEGQTVGAGCLPIKHLESS